MTYQYNITENCSKKMMYLSKKIGVHPNYSNLSDLRFMNYNCVRQVQKKVNDRLGIDVAKADEVRQKGNELFRQGTNVLGSILCMALLYLGQDIIIS